MFKKKFKISTQNTLSGKDRKVMKGLLSKQMDP